MLWFVTRLIFKTSAVTPDFFYVFNLILSFSTYSQSFNKICAWEVLGANVLNCHAGPLTTSHLCCVVVCVAPHGISSNRETACSPTLENLRIKYALRSHVQAILSILKTNYFVLITF